MEKGIQEEVRRQILKQFSLDEGKEYLELRTDNDYNTLSARINNEVYKGKERCLNLNTLKRFFDHWKKGLDYSFSKNTLDTLAKYVSFGNWSDLEVNLFAPMSGFIENPSVEIGSKWVVKYWPDREVTLMVIGENRYRIIATNVEKLEKGDEGTARIFVAGSLFCLTDMVRGGTPIGDYCSAPGHVITRIKKTFDV